MEVEEFLKDRLKTENALPLEMTEEDEMTFKQASVCHICSKTLGGDSVRDHYHITGEYRGAAPVA